MRFAILGLVMLSGMTVAARAQDAAAPAAQTYVNENSIDPAPLKLKELAGKVKGFGGEAMPRATVSLFTERGHSLISSVMTDREGKFRFEKVEHGMYRVVAKVDGLCTANIPVLLEGSLLGHRKLEITMRPKGLDTCSYGMAK